MVMPQPGAAPGPKLSPMEEMLGLTTPLAPTGAEGGLSPGMSSILLGGGPTAEAAGSAPPPGPSSDVLPAAAPPAPAPAPQVLPAQPTSEETAETDMWRDFESRHGRPPTKVDIQAARMIPALQASLGRAPMRIEVLQQLQGRQETPAASADSLQFEPDIQAQP